MDRPMEMQLEPFPCDLRGSPLPLHCGPRQLAQRHGGGKGNQGAADDSDDDLTVWQYLCKVWQQKKEQDEDDLTLNDLLKQGVQRKLKKERKDRRRGPTPQPSQRRYAGTPFWGHVA